MAGLHLGKRWLGPGQVPPGPNGHVYQVWYKRRPGQQARLLAGQFSGPNPAGRFVSRMVRAGRHGAFYSVPVGDNPNHPELSNAFGPGKSMWGWFIHFE
jgi:hypothetical protein